jgi:hypothetical protein
VVYFGKIPVQIDQSLKFMPVEKPGIEDLIKQQQPQKLTCKKDELSVS